jgi:hypothetical protein
MRGLLKVVSGLAIVVGLVWIGQGTGLLPWPASSFMVNDSRWAIRGAGLAIAGVIGIVVSRRRSRSRS